MSVRIYKQTISRAAALGKAAALLLVCCGAQAGSELRPAGLATYTETARDIYVAGLLLPPGTQLHNVYLAPGPKAMEYRIATRRISSRAFSGTLLLQAEMGSGERASEQVMEVLNSLKESLKGPLVKGDSFVIVLSEEDETSFYLNTTELLTVSDGAVFDFFFAGWVGETSSGLLRGSLLAGDLNPDILARFAALAPAENRVAVVASWMAPMPHAPAPAPAPEKEAKKAPQETPKASAVAVVKVVETPATETQVAKTPLAVGKTPTAEFSEPAALTTAAASVAKAAPVVTKTAPKAVPSVARAAPAKVKAAPKKAQLASAEKFTLAMPAVDDTEHQRLVGEYVGHVMSRVNGNVIYPRRSVKRNQQGKVELLARMDAKGELLDLTLENSSGHSLLDKAASKAVRKAAPFPELSPVAKEEFLAEDGSSYVVLIPVTFKLQE